MNYIFHPEAEAEFAAAVAFYDAKEFRLGLAFAEEVYDGIQRILSFPMAWPHLLRTQDTAICNKSLSVWDPIFH